MADGTHQHVRSGFGQTLEAAVLERARRGDMAAFAAIYDLFGPACYNLALRVLGEPAAAEDIVQEVFLRLFGGLRKFRGDAPFGAWLRRMTANATIDALRGRQHVDDADADALFDAMPAQDIDAESRTDIWSALMRLPPRARGVVVLHELEGYTHRELADLFGRTESWSKSVLSRALTHLRGGAANTNDEVGDHG